MEIHCSHTKTVPIDSLIPNPKNPNQHPKAQIELLAKIIKHQGWRNPIVVSKRSGFIVKGHARLEAAKLNKSESVPIDEQDYPNEAMEWADMIADNKIAELVETDRDLLQEIAIDLGKDFDFDLLGLPDFFLPTVDGDGKPRNYFDEWEGMPEFIQDNKKAFRSIIVHLFDEAAVKEFEKLTKQQITDKTRFIWIPEQVREKAEDKRYGEP